MKTKHDHIFRKHIYAMHKEAGKFYNSPDCCIEQFSKEQCYKIPSAEFRKFCHNLPIDKCFNEIFNIDIDYVPCDKCVKKLIKNNK